MNDPILSIQGLYKTYRREAGEITLFQDFSLTVEKGEFLCIVGPSGCGKTTLLKLAGGFDPDYEGLILEQNSPIHGPSPHRVMIFQDAGQLFPWMTVLQNIQFPLLIQKVPRQQATEAARQALQATALAGWEDYYPHQLSGGMKQRAALARALAMKPEILMMDEPFSSLDPETRTSLQDLIKALQQERQITILFVTHDREEAARLATRQITLTAPRLK